MRQNKTRQIQWNLSIEDTIGPSWLSCIQWNLSIEDTIGSQLALLYREVSLLQRSICTQLCVAGTADSVLTREVSLSRSVLYREVHCTSLFGHLNTMTDR